MADIVIKAKGAETFPLDELIPMQGNLKELSEANFVKLHDLIITKGFDSPIQVWVRPEGTISILDGHQRVRILKKLRDEGWTIPPIPVDFISADSYKDAKERLLTKVSVYGQVIEDGLEDFINEPDAIIEPDFGDMLDIPGIDFGKDEVEAKASGEPAKPSLVTCPQCQTQFNPKGNEA